MSRTSHESRPPPTITPQTHPEPFKAGVSQSNAPDSGPRRSLGDSQHEASEGSIRNLGAITTSSAGEHSESVGLFSRLTRPFRKQGSPVHQHPNPRAHTDANSHSHSHGTCRSGPLHPLDEIVLKGTGAEIDASDGAGDFDVEKGPTDYQRFVLNIDGLKSGCCETGVTRTVNHISAIRDHRLDCIMARLELDLDINRQSIDDVVKLLNTSTPGLTFSQMNSKPQGQVLELLHTNTLDFRHGPQPKGITSIEFPDPPRQFWITSWQWTISNLSLSEMPEMSPERLTPKLRHPQLVCIHYDAKVIGPRDILEFYQRKSPHLMLAPPMAHPSIKPAAHSGSLAHTHAQSHSHSRNSCCSGVPHDTGAKQTRRAMAWFMLAFVFTVPALVLAWAPIDHDKIAYAHVSMALASIVQIIAWIEFLPGALRSLKTFRVLNMEFLISISTMIAYVFSVVCYAYQVVGKPMETESFFETSTLLVTLILLGRLINEFARHRAANAISFRSLQTDNALLVESGNGTKADPPTREIDARFLQYGDSFKVLPHTRIVTDGTVYYGGSEVDESMLTGEAIPVAKGLHSEVYAGTMNGSGTLLVVLRTLPHENTVHKIATMVESAELTKPRIQALADRVAGWFVTVIAMTGLLVFLTWLLVDRFRNKRSWFDAVVRAITYAIATLVVSCPCAIGLAVPMVVLVAGGVAARHGVVFRDPRKLEIARNTTDVIFDKTGTLTTGYFSVVSEQYCGTMQPRQIKSILLGLFKDNKHPIALGVFDHVLKESRMSAEPDLTPDELYDIFSIPGEGVIGILRHGNHEVRAGNPDWLSLHVEESNCSYLCVTIAGQVSAVFKLRDTPKHNAGRIIELLEKRHITVHLISGDSQGSVDAAAHELNIPKRFSKSRCKPEGKQTYIQDIQSKKWRGRNRIVLFVGDGTNDAVALKQADVGAHMHSPHSTSDVAKQAADVVLMTERLVDVLVMLDISRGAYRRITSNFAWSAAYNLGAVLLAAGAFSSIKKGGQEIRIPPQWAGLGELVSVLPVVGVAFQMRWRDYGRKFKDI